MEEVEADDEASPPFSEFRVCELPSSTRDAAPFNDEEEQAEEEERAVSLASTTRSSVLEDDEPLATAASARASSFPVIVSPAFDSILSRFELVTTRVSIVRQNPGKLPSRPSSP